MFVNVSLENNLKFGYKKKPIQPFLQRYTRRDFRPPEEKVNLLRVELLRCHNVSGLQINIYLE
jgi:hypothetical protein